MKLIINLRRTISGPDILTINKWVDHARTMGMKTRYDYKPGGFTITIDGDGPPEREVSAAQFEQRIRDGQTAARRQRELGITPGPLPGEAIGPLVNSLARRYGLSNRKAPVNAEAGPDTGGLGGTVHIDINPDVVAAWQKVGESLGGIFAKFADDLARGIDNGW